MFQLTSISIVPLLVLVLTVAVIVSYWYGYHSNNTNTSNTDTNDPVILSYEKTPCFGFCPTYTVLLHQSGKAVIQVHELIPDAGITSGSYQRQLSPEQVGAIFQDASDIGFWQLDPVYDANISDLPSTIIEMLNPVTGHKHKVTARVEVPESLEIFSERLHQVWMAALLE